MSTERRQVRQVLEKYHCEQVDSAADEIIDIINETRPLPGAWALATGGRILKTDADKLAEQIGAIGDKLERELRFNNLSAHRDFNTVAKKIIEAEKRGQSLDTWISWAKRDEKSRAYLFTYARNPNLIWMDWLQAFPVTTARTESDGGMYV